MQQEFIQLCKDLSEETGLKFQNKGQYSNNGRVYFRDDDYNTIANIYYSFQDGYFSIYLNEGENTRAVIGGRSKDCEHWMSYVETCSGEQIRRCFKKIKTVVRKSAMMRT